MKKFLYIVIPALGLVACNNDGDNVKSTDDTTVTGPIDEMSNPNRVPGSNMPGEGLGNGDTSSYQITPQPTDTLK